jgi:molecular chaperone GrpE (heat shock protein)
LYFLFSKYISVRIFQIIIATGEAIDTKKMEVLQQIETEDDVLVNTVISVIRPGMIDTTKGDVLR